MDIAIGVHTGVATGGATTLTTGSLTTTSGSLVLVGASWDSTPTFTSITDSKSNSWSIVGSELNASSHKSRVYVAHNITGGSSHTFTLTVSASAVATLFVCEFTGADTASAVDQQGRRNDTSSPFTLAAGLTTTQANEALWSMVVGNSSSPTATHAESGLGSSTIQDEITNGSLYWTGAQATSIKSATGTFNPSWTENGATNAHVWLVTIKEAAAAAGVFNIMSGRGGAAAQPLWHT